MNENSLKAKLNELSHMLILIEVSLFSLVLLAFNRIFNWENWMFFILLAGFVCSWAARVTQALPQRLKLYIYSFTFLFQLFYFSGKAIFLYDITIVFALFLGVAVMSQNKVIIYATLTSGYASMLFNLFFVSLPSNVGVSCVMRISCQFLSILFIFLITSRVMRMWNDTVQNFQEKIDAIDEETKRENAFLAKISHELRTPVNAVLGLSSVLKEANLTQKARDNVNAISKAGQRIAEQINDILDFTEIDMQKLAVSEEPYLVTALVNDIVSLVKQEYDFKLPILIDVEPNVPSELEGDASKLKKIIWHLLKNSIKFTNEGGIYVHLSAIKRDYGVNLIIEVADTGCGIADDEIDAIYSKFYQTSTSRAHSAGGLGLGLSIVYGFVRAMKGVATIDSTVGSGTTVRVSIPQKVVDNENCLTVEKKANICIAAYMNFTTITHPIVREFYTQMIGHMVSQMSLSFHRIASKTELEKLDFRYRLTHLFLEWDKYRGDRAYFDALADRIHLAIIAGAGFQETVPDTITLIPDPFCSTALINFLHEGRSLKLSDEVKMRCPGLRVLVVDDEPINLIVAKGIFERYGMSVTTAASGYEAIDLCIKNDFDLIFMDYMMPVMDGIEAMKKLRFLASKSKKTLRIVVLTANATSSAKEMFLSEGFDGFVSKPIERVELDRTLKQVLPKDVVEYEDDSSEEKENSHQNNSVHSVLVDVDRAAGLAYCQNDEGFYKSVLLEYAKDPAKKIRELIDFYDARDWHNYKIRIHALKSSSKVIGAMSLSETALKLEEAAARADEAAIDKCHPGFMVEYEAVLRAINSKYAADSGETK